MITTIIVACEYQNSLEQWCSGAMNDLESMRTFLQGDKYLFSDRELPEPNSYHCSNNEKFFQDLNTLNYLESKLLIFYFSGHGQRRKIKISSTEKYISLKRLRRFFSKRLSQDSEIIFICDCCESGSLDLPFRSVDNSSFIQRNEEHPKNYTIFISAGRKVALGDRNGSALTRALVKHFQPYLPMNKLLKRLRKDVPVLIYTSENTISSVPLQERKRVYLDEMGVPKVKNYLK